MSKKRKKQAGGCIGCGLTLCVMTGFAAAGFLWLNRAESVQQVLSLQAVSVKQEMPELSGQLNSTHALLVDLETGLPLFGKAQDTVTWPASLTKMMTVILAIESLPDLEEKITLSEGMFPALYAADASLAGFTAGEQVQVIDLLYGAMLPSGAECTIGLAERIAGSEEAFAGQMNRKAAELGMLQTHFVNVTGLHHPEHYSTASDMALLLRYALKNETFRAVFTASEHTSSPTNKHPQGVSFQSTLFKRLDQPEFPGGAILGGKTGYTGEAGLCLASLAERDGREFLFISTGAEGTQAREPLYIADAKWAYSRAMGYLRQQRLGHMAASGVGLASSSSPFEDERI